MTPTSFIARALTRVYYRRISVIGRDHVPTDGVATFAVAGDADVDGMDALILARVSSRARVIAVGAYEHEMSRPPRERLRGPVLPVALSYRNRDEFRSSVTVVIGRPLEIAFDDAGGHADAIRGAVHALSVPTNASRDRLATLLAGADGARYHAMRRLLAHEPLPDDVFADWVLVDAAIERGELETVDGEIVRAKSSRFVDPLWQAVRALLDMVAVVSGVVANVVPLLAARAGERYGHASHSIAARRVRAAAPVAIAWALVIVSIALAMGRWKSAFAYCEASILGYLFYPAFRQRLARRRNARASAEVRSALERVIRWGVVGSGHAAQGH